LFKLLIELLQEHSILCSDHTARILAGLVAVSMTVGGKLVFQLAKLCFI